MKKVYKFYYQEGLSGVNHDFFIRGINRKITVNITDIDDYSIFIKKNLGGTKIIYIKTKKSPYWYRTAEIISNPCGSILYFKEQVGKVFKKGCMYPIITDTPMVQRITDLVNKMKSIKYT